MRSTFTVGGWISILRPLNSRKRQNEKAQSEDASVIDPRVRHQLSCPQIQIARGLAMNPKKLGEVDKY